MTFLTCPSDEAPELSCGPSLTALDNRMKLLAKEIADLWDMSARADELGREDWRDEYGERAQAKEAEYAVLMRRHGDIEGGF